MKNPKITILFWVLVIGFLNLVSVDAKERSKVVTFFLSRQSPRETVSLNITSCFCCELWKFEELLTWITTKAGSIKKVGLTAYSWARRVPSTKIAISTENIRESSYTKLTDSMDWFVYVYVVEVSTVSLRGTIHISH